MFIRICFLVLSLSTSAFLPAQTPKDSLPLFIVGKVDQPNPNQALVKGTVINAQNEDPIVSATIRVTPGQTVAITDENGDFELAVKPGAYRLVLNALGYGEISVQLIVHQSGTVRIPIQVQAIDLEQVIVKGTGTDHNLREVTAGLERLSAARLDRQGKLFGEMDVLRSLQSVAGVSSVGEGASGINVRGGNADENLILQDNHLIFNPVHALGIFSLFHPDLVQEVLLYKGNVPAKYGGRLSSVLEINLKEGDLKKTHGQLGLGLASSRLSLQGPVIKDHASYFIGLRGSYLDWLLKQSNSININQSSALFYDITAKADARLTKSTKVGFSIFNSSDDFQFSDEVKFEYQTKSGVIYLKQLIGNKININANLNVGQYNSSLFDLKGNDQSKFNSSIRYWRTNINGQWQINKAQILEAGREINYYQVLPGELEILSASSVLAAQKLELEDGRESAWFVEYKIQPTSKLEINAGLRYISYQNLGPELIYTYAQGEPKSENSIIDSISFMGQGKIISYQGWEPRISARISLSERSAIKLGYNRAYQFLSQISNTASANPIDIWQLSNQHIQPQQADNFSIGYYHNFNNNTAETYLNLFYRQVDRLLDYKDFAELLLNDHIETELVFGVGKAYGVEFYIHKRFGKHQFELNETFSRSWRKVIATSEQPAVNDGRWYPSNYDKPNVLNLNYLFQINPKNSLSINFTHSTGRPTTAPISSYAHENLVNLPVYSQRNAFRIPDYHRLDFAYTVGPWGKKHFKHSITASVYNVYARKNAFSVFFRQNAFQKVRAYQIAVLGTAFPGVTYNISF